MRMSYLMSEKVNSAVPFHNSFATELYTTVWPFADQNAFLGQRQK